MLIRRGTFKNFNWFIARNLLGIKCAYVDIADDVFVDVFKHPFDIYDDFDLNIQDETTHVINCIHGGCTFARHGGGCSFEMFSTQPWNMLWNNKQGGIVTIGWDYGHYGDYQMDSSGNYQSIVSDDSIIKDIEEVISAITDKMTLK